MSGLQGPLCFVPQNHHDETGFHLEEHRFASANSCLHEVGPDVEVDFAQISELRRCWNGAKSCDLMLALSQKEMLHCFRLLFVLFFLLSFSLKRKNGLPTDLSFWELTEEKLL